MRRFGRWALGVARLGSGTCCHSVSRATRRLADSTNSTSAPPFAHNCETCPPTSSSANPTTPPHPESTPHCRLCRCVSWLDSMLMHHPHRRCSAGIAAAVVWACDAKPSRPSQLATHACQPTAQRTGGRYQVAGMVVGAMVVLTACVIVLLKGLRLLRMYRLFRGAKVVITTIVIGVLIVVLVRCATACALRALRREQFSFSADRCSQVPLSPRSDDIRHVVLFPDLGNASVPSLARREREGRHGCSSSLRERQSCLRQLPPGRPSVCARALSTDR